MKNELQIFKNDLFEIAVTLEDGQVLFEAETLAISLGFTQTKNNKTYVRWDRVNQYLKEIGFPHQVGKGDLLPESVGYLLGMKGENERALKFQKWLAIDVVPQIRKTGSYTKPLTKKDELRLYLETLEEQDAKIEAVSRDVEELKNDMPLLAIDCDRITTAVRTVGVNCLGGKGSPAYNNVSIRAKVYSDIYGQLKREFGVTTYKAIKRRQCDAAVEIIKNYKLPYALAEQVAELNSQLSYV